MSGKSEGTEAPGITVIGDFGAPVVLPVAELAAFRKGVLLVVVLALLASPLVFCL